MNILIDINVILDVLLKRLPWDIEASQIWTACEVGVITGFLGASALTDVFFLVQRAQNATAGLNGVDLVLQTFEIIAVDRPTLIHARALPGNDFEDNLQSACAMIAGLDAIMTRDPKGFAAAPLPVLTPRRLLAQL